MTKPNWDEADIYRVAETDEERRDYALYTANEQYKFYQREVLVNCFWFRALTITTLVGSALTPLFALFFTNKAWIALPSAIAGLAAAANSAFHFEEEWVQSYYTLSAIDVEIGKFKGRASADYAPDRPLSQAADAFQRRIGEIVMSEVRLWRKGRAQEAHHHKAQRTGGTGL